MWQGLANSITQYAYNNLRLNLDLILQSLTSCVLAVFHFDAKLLLIISLGDLNNTFKYQDKAR